MCQYSAAAVALSFIALGFAVGQVPESSRGATGIYFPTTPGARVVYNYGDDEVVDVVVKVERSDDSYLVTTETLSSNKKLLSERWSVSKDNLSRVGHDGTVEEPPNCVMKAEVDPNHWTAVGVG